MMHHDLKTADRTYNRQTMEEKIALGVEFINQQNFGLNTCVSQLQPIAS
ncbi:MAG: hypothetical protein QNJ41_29870 [Xenococcaceae cyanobacterium MO_188.B32]|nr:hypothetical protein [Xenococcaceae cyanobacterium MO_188.B32]